MENNLEKQIKEIGGEQIKEIDATPFLLSEEQVNQLRRLAKILLYDPRKDEIIRGVSPYEICC